MAKKSNNKNGQEKPIVWQTGTPPAGLVLMIKGSDYMGEWTSRAQRKDFQERHKGRRTWRWVDLQGVTLTHKDQPEAWALIVDKEEGSKPNGQEGEDHTMEEQEKKVITKDEVLGHFETSDKVKVVFEKKDKTIRTMLCTRKRDVIPEEFRTEDGSGNPGPGRPVPDHLVAAFDLEAGGWRSITVANIISIDAG